MFWEDIKKVCETINRLPSAMNDSQNDVQPTAKHGADQAEALPRYQYQALNQDAQEIRLVKLLPSQSTDDPIKLEFHRVPLKGVKKAADPRLSYDQLQETLPSDWDVSQTKEGRYIFWKNKFTAQWVHPVLDMDRALYHWDGIFEPYPDVPAIFEGIGVHLRYSSQC